MTVKVVEWASVIVLVLGITAYAVIDGLVLLGHQPQNTVSRITYNAVHDYPIIGVVIGLAIGVLFGHLFWSQHNLP